MSKVVMKYFHILIISFLYLNGFFILAIFSSTRYIKVLTNDWNDSEKTKVLLTSAAHVHLKHVEFSKHIRTLSPARRVILLSGPNGMFCGNDN